jgi:hypothetical protein
MVEHHFGGETPIDWSSSDVLSSHVYYCNSYVLVKIVVVKPDGPPKLCKTDEVGELCVASGTVGSAYFGLVGKTNHTFKVQ